MAAASGFGWVPIVLLTAMATIGAFVYSPSTDLIGGIEVTLGGPRLARIARPFGCLAWIAVISSPGLGCLARAGRELRPLERFAHVKGVPCRFESSQAHNHVPAPDVT